ncbi:MAG: hypothetical protein RBT66_07065 [bacterium]|jgi:hypothetical protein|nr:hypothetical protein [bacterium]
MAKRQSPTTSSSEQPVPGTTIVRSGAGGNPRVRLLIATPTLGIVRLEWSIVRFGQVIPCNWSSHDVTVGLGYTVPMHYLVADGQNIAVDACLAGNYEWLLLWEDDVIAPPDLFCKLDPYIRNADVPVVSGLYFLKADRVEPILYRGSGTRAFDEFALGRKVWVDGVPTGMLLIHREVLALMAAESELYTTLGGKRVPKVFETPAKMFQDPRSGDWVRQQGTSDLAWCKRVMREKVLTRAGWPKIGRRQYPFLCDTSILCRHIDLSSGRQYPSDAGLHAFRSRKGAGL